METAGAATGASLAGLTTGLTAAGLTSGLSFAGRGPVARLGRHHEDRARRQSRESEDRAQT